MAEVFRLGDTGIPFRVKLVDCKLDEDFDVSNVTDQKIIFVKPNGIRLEVQAAKVEDPNGSGIFFIEFINTEPSILDLTGNWSYAGKILTANSKFTSATILFWVE